MMAIPAAHLPSGIALTESGAMNFKEHWRLRLQELLTSTHLTQAAFADHAGITPDYVSRLLYPPEKPGRKSLGPVTIRRICEAFELPMGWFDLPLGSDLPGTTTYASSQHAKSAHHVSDVSAKDEPRKIDPIVWPFRIVTYQRIARLREHFQGRNMPPAIADIDKHLDVLVTRWENEMTKSKSSAA